MKVYNGWVLEIKGVEYTVVGSNKIRGKQYYCLRSNQGLSAINRDSLLEGVNDKSIKYITSVPVK